MSAARWTETLQALRKLIMQPVCFHDLRMVIVDALPAKHDPDWQMDAHRHPWFEFNYVAEGAVYTSIEGVEFRIEAGQSYLIPPGAAHAHRNAEGAGDDGFCLRWLFAARDDKRAELPHQIVAEEMIALFQERRPYALPPELNEPLLQIDGGMHPLVVQTALLAWVSKLYEAWAAPTEDEHEEAGDSGDPVVRQALLYLEEYYSVCFNVQEVANALHVSYRHLSRLFKRKTGVSLVEKLNDIRVTRAKTLLLETELPLREIARETGFANEFYFSHVFRRHTLMPPSDYRNANIAKAAPRARR